MSGWLSGWKEIAEYLGVTPATAKKYKVKNNLPIYRRPGGRVTALPRELDEWLKKNIKKSYAI